MTNADRIVSSESEELILVDADDREIGFQSKASCHDGDGILHRAFSVFLFNDAGELLLQQRSESKRLWPGFWSNTCCSHPRRGETMQIATRRRLRDELNVEGALEFVYKFSYQANYRNLGAEHELCHVYVGRQASDASANAHEIAAVRYASPEALSRELDDNEQQFTPWFRLEWQALLGDYAAVLSRYTNL